MRKVLLVEDSVHDIELALEVFSEESIAEEVVVVKDGQQALDFLQSASEEDKTGAAPILVMLDLKLPKVGGLEVLRRIKSDPGLHDIPIVMFTSSREESDLKHSYALGANAYVVKPIDFEDYIRAVRSLTEFWTEINQPPPVIV
ncbi:MAG: response regulator [Armatimonas sp.]